MNATNTTEVGKYYLKGVIEKNGCQEDVHFTVTVNSAPTVAFAVPLGTATTIGGPPAILTGYFGAVMKYKIPDTQLNDTDLHNAIEIKTYTYSYAASNYPNPDVYIQSIQLDIDPDNMYVYAKCGLWLAAGATADFITQVTDALHKTTYYYWQIVCNPNNPPALIGPAAATHTV